MLSVFSAKYLPKLSNVLYAMMSLNFNLSIFLLFQGYGNKRTTLYDIRAELNVRYKDLRQPYRSPSNEEKFNMETKETPQTFYIGMCRLNY